MNLFKAFLVICALAWTSTLRSEVPKEFCLKFKTSCPQMTFEIKSPEGKIGIIYHPPHEDAYYLETPSHQLIAKGIKKTCGNVFEFEDADKNSLGTMKRKTSAGVFQFYSPSNELLAESQPDFWCKEYKIKDVKDGHLIATFKSCVSRREWKGRIHDRQTQIHPHLFYTLIISQCLSNPEYNTTTSPLHQDDLSE